VLLLKLALLLPSYNHMLVNEPLLKRYILNGCSRLN
jgi:hypothetical protein